MRRAAAATAAALLLAFGPPAAPAAGQEVQLVAPRSGTAAPLQVWASHAEGVWTVRIADEAGRERQRLAVPGEAGEATPFVADADGDEAGDLWVPVMGGTANIAYALWIMQPREGRFRPAGEVSGLAFARDPGGWLVAQARNGCCAVSLTFYAFPRSGGLREVFAIERQLGPDGSMQRCTPRGAVPRDVLRPWCGRGGAAEGWPPGVTPLLR